MTRRPRVDVGVVTWNSAGLTSEALRRLVHSDQGVDLRVLVWDNASEDGTAEAIAAATPDVEVIRSPENLGFAKAVNHLVKRSDAPWFFALNSDAWPEPGAIGRLAAIAARHERAAAIAPKLLRPDGSLEHSTHPFPSLAMGLVDAAGLRPFLPRRWADDRCLEGVWGHDRLRQVDWAVGAALLLRRRALDAVGGFDERFFMYQEDLYWCYRARALGWEIWFEPASVVRHVGGVSGRRRFGEQRAVLEDVHLRCMLTETMGAPRASVHHALQTTAAARSYARARLAGEPGERAYWRVQLRAALGLVRPPVLADPDAWAAEDAPNGDGTPDTVPLVTVVVPTHDRYESLERLVRALETQTMAPGSFEVVIVDDPSSEGAWSELVRITRSSTCAVRPVRTPRDCGPAVKRNVGWRTARASVVAFTDDDCVPDPKWLEMGLAAFEGRPRIVVGSTRPPDDQLALMGRPFARAMEVDRPLFFETCNIFYRRRDLEAVGGFDERFRLPAGEDTHLGLRVSELGIEPVFVEDALVHHDVRPGGSRAALAEARRWIDLPLALKGRAYARYERVHRRIFWKRSHPPAILAAVGLVLGLRWRTALALVVPWVAYRLRRDPVCADPVERVSTLPAALAVDLTEVVTMVRGSLRHRTPLL